MGAVASRFQGPGLAIGGYAGLEGRRYHYQRMGNVLEYRSVVVLISYPFETYLQITFIEYEEEYDFRQRFFASCIVLVVVLVLVV